MQTMRRFIAAVLLLVLCLGGGLSLAEEGETTLTNEAVFLPQGIWSLGGDGAWTFIVQADISLSLAQQEVAEREEIPAEGGILKANTSLTTEQLTILYPGMEAHLSLPTIKPELELFGLTGEWFYDEEGVLYYDHGEGYTVMTQEEVFAALNGSTPPAASEKIIYLTIDDSPSIYTMDFLATLERLNVKATFFVVGAYVKQRPVYMRAIYEAGHGIANHSYSHDAVNLASSYKNCLRDFQRCEEAVADALGFPLPMPILRVPYGAGTLPVSFRSQLQADGYLWIDWNALNGDTESTVTSDQAALDRAFSTAKRYDGSIVMLVHDGKKRTIRTMETMVKHFRDQGYEFRVLDTNIEKMPGVRMGLPKK